MGDKIGKCKTGQGTQACFQKGCFLARVLMYSSTKKKDVLIRLVSIHCTRPLHRYTLEEAHEKICPS